MLVDVVRMRQHGAKLSRAEIRAKAPIRGHLSLSTHIPGSNWRAKQSPLLAGLTLPTDVTWAIPPLLEARVSRIRGNELVINGIEEHDAGRGKVVRVAQSWWCRLMDGAAPAPGIEADELPAGTVDGLVDVD